MPAELTFVVPAYGRSPYLRECLASLRAQTKPVPIAIATSTPNEHVQALAEEFSCPVHVNQSGGGIAADWNFALSCQPTGFVALAHQDDIYRPEYAERCLQFFARHPQVGIAFTDSAELIGDRLYRNNKREVVKKLLRKFAFLWRDVITRPSQFRRLLGVGCAVPCPSVVYNQNQLGEFRFSAEYGVNLDWDAWTRITEAGHAVGYVRGALLIHRIHPEAETQKGLSDRRRDQEDRKMFLRYWPESMARLLLYFYRLGY